MPNNDTQVSFLNHQQLIAQSNDWQARMKDLWSIHHSRAPIPGSSLRASPRGFALLQPHPGNIYAVMTHANKVMGVATVIPGQTSHKSFVQVEDFIVHPKHLRKGYGRDLMLALLNHFDAGDHYFFAHVEVHPSREAMIALLHAMHFVQRAQATSNESGAIHVFRHNFFDPE